VIRGNWFDEDYTVIDAQGQLVCQARQLALAPLG
ncbi:MAG TPA: thioesterase family protein, partial [Pseudonocardia sp.]